MWSRFLRLKISLAAVFCTRCSGSTVDCGRPARTELQKSSTKSPLGLVAYLVTYFHSKIQNCQYIGAADVNGASRQPTSRQHCDS